MDTYENNPEENEFPESAEEWDDEPLPESKETPPVSNPVAPEQPHEPAYSAPYTPPTYREQLAKQKKKSHSFLRSAVALLLVVALVAGGCVFTYSAVDRRWAQKSEQDGALISAMNEKIESLESQLKTVNRRADTAAAEAAVTDGSVMTPRQVYSAYSDCVVAVSSTVQAVTFGGQTSQGTSTGSGFILTEDGYVVTNYHVIEGAVSVKVIVSSGEEYDAKIIGYESINDVAVVKIDAENLPAVVLGSSDELKIGDMVAAIGNPLGALTATLTVGYVSGKNREVSTDSSTIINMIQTDAAINSGNSGGPLFNMYGEVVGITSAKYSGTTSSGASIEGISFAIPIDDVMSIIGDLRDFGYVTGAYLGVTVQNTDAASASLFGLPTGAYVVTTVEGGSAARAGVQPKDIIIRLGEYDVANVSELTRTLRRFKAGDTTTITVIRSGERITMDITLDEKPKDLNAPAQPDKPMPENGDYNEWYDYFYGKEKKGG